MGGCYRCGSKSHPCDCAPDVEEIEDLQERCSRLEEEREEVDTESDRRDAYTEVFKLVLQNYLAKRVDGTDLVTEVTEKWTERFLTEREIFAVGGKKDE